MTSSGRQRSVARWGGEANTIQNVDKKCQTQRRKKVLSAVELQVTGGSREGRRGS